MRRFIIYVVLLTLWVGAIPSATHAQTEPVTITILNTADEHGWLQPFTPFGSTETYGGAAILYRWWQEFEGYEPASFLLLSGGDNWTGPSISTWFEGQPIVEAFNVMGYAASAIGNHEFDFGREIMQERFAEANYPYLAANIRIQDSGELLAQPYAIFEVQGIKIGVIGLTTLDTVTTTHPKNISDLEFIPFLEALEMFVPSMQADGATIIVALTHACSFELGGVVSSGWVDAVFTGHCNEKLSRQVDGVSLMGGGDAWRSYARLTLTVDPTTGTILDMEQAIVDVAYPSDAPSPVEPDPDLSAIVDYWQEQVDAALAREIGYTMNGIQQRSHSMGNLITDAWLWAYPSAEIALTNWGGMRQALDAGPITWGDIVSILPFENQLVVVQITGAQLIENLRCCGGAAGGISYSSDGTVQFLDGRPFDPTATYTVLISDFMYLGGDNYRFGQQDPDGYDTSIQWRQPVIDYIAALATTAETPLDFYLDNTARVR